MRKNSYRKERQENKGEPYCHKYFRFAAYSKWNRYWNRMDRVDKRLRNQVRSRFWQRMVTGLYGDDLRQSIEGFKRYYDFGITNPKKAIRRKNEIIR